MSRTCRVRTRFVIQRTLKRRTALTIIPNSPRPEPPLLRYIKCDKCGRLRSIKHEQLCRYWYGKWPVCCGTPMTLLKECAFSYYEAAAIRRSLAEAEKKKK